MLNTKLKQVVPIPFQISNVYLVRGKRSILVDAANPGYSPAILKQVIKAGVNPKEISLILLTHGHIDHYGSALELREQFGIPIAVHKADADNLRRGRNPRLIPTGSLISRLLSPYFERQTTRAFEPDILLEGETSLEEFGVEGKVIPLPGHSPGSVVVSLESREILVGDLFGGGAIRKHKPQYHFFADDLSVVRKSIGRVLELAPKTLYPGHFGPLRAEDVVRRFAAS